MPTNTSLPQASSMLPAAPVLVAKTMLADTPANNAPEEEKEESRDKA